MALSTEKKVPSLLELYEINWRMLYEEATRQGLLGITYVAVEAWIHSEAAHKSRNLISHTLLAAWDGYAEMIKASSVKKNDSCSMISKYFEEQGYNTCILKGQGNAALYGKNLSLYRNSGDVDIWVYDSKCKSIVESRRKVIGYVLDKTAEQCVQLKHIDFPCFKDVDVEVHFMPNGTFNLRLNRWYEK